MVTQRLAVSQFAVRLMRLQTRRKGLAMKPILLALTLTLAVSAYPDDKTPPTGTPFPGSGSTTAVVHSPILTCDKQVLNCSVNGMVFLSQSDKHIDADVEAGKEGGCWDTSILMTVLAALHNSKQKSSGRTKALLDLTATATPDNPNATAIKELSQIYRWSLAFQKGRAVQAYGFPETLADLAPVKNAVCDPLKFGSCKRFTNAAGETWSATYPSPQISIAAIKKLMSKGYVVLLKYQYYVATPATVGGVPALTFAAASPHKVVFSGFSSDPAYPFFIANAGNGLKQRASLRYDIHRFTNSVSTPVIFPQGQQLYLDIEGNPNAGFIQAIEVLKINTDI
jgi:hypothetical protein